MSALRALSAALAILCAAAALLVGLSQPRDMPGGEEWPRSAINDRPLLTEAQRKAAAAGEAVAFECAGKHYAASGMPDEYVYSSYKE